MLVLLAAVVPFYGALGGGFLAWDDQMLLVENQRWLGPDGWRWMLLDSAGGDFGPYMPLTWLSYRLGHGVHGLDARAFLVTNIVLHAVAAVLLLQVATRLYGARLNSPAFPIHPVPGSRRSGKAGELSLAPYARGAALAAALLWAAHPLRVEAVCWIAQRREVLSGALLLLSLLAWLRHVDGGRRWWSSGAWWGALAAYAAAMLSKSTPMAWPLVLLLLDAWPLRRGVSRSTLVEKAPFAVVATLVAAAAWAGQADTGALADVSLPGRIVLGAHGAAFLVAASVLPVGLHTHYPRPIPFDAADPAFLVPALLAVLGTLVVLARARRSPAVAVAWGSALLLLAPVSGLVPIGSHAIADRYTYLAAIPLTLLAAGGGAALLAARPRVAGGLAVAAVLALGAQSARLSVTWRSTEALFERVLSIEPRSWFAHFMLGALAEERGDDDTARRHYAEWVRLHGSADAHARLAALQLEAGDVEAGLASVDAALVVEPEHAMARQLLGTHLAITGDTTGAEREWRRALASDPELVVAHVNLARLLAGTGREAEAREHLATALRLDPTDDRARRLAEQLGVE